MQNGMKRMGHLTISKPSIESPTFRQHVNGLTPYNAFYRLLFSTANNNLHYASRPLGRLARKHFLNTLFRNNSGSRMACYRLNKACHFTTPAQPARFFYELRVCGIVTYHYLLTTTFGNNIFAKKMPQRPDSSLLKSTCVMQSLTSAWMGSHSLQGCFLRTSLLASFFSKYSCSAALASASFSGNGTSFSVSRRLYTRGCEL